ncbi:MAG: FAD-binding oxidoreductase [Fibrobacteria bacterium]|nr:FAD-binding oxidoreductase [Fibrobacteria bacterium]
MHRDVVILGGGIVGLSIAREASRFGLSALVLERDRVGSHASGAAAGLLVSRGVVRSSVPGRMFYTQALQSYPRWVADLERESGLSVPLHTTDDWCFFCPCGRADRFRDRLERESDPALWEETDLVPPGLGTFLRPTSFRVFRFHEERWLRPGDLLPALRDAAIHVGSEVMDGVGEPRVERLATGGFRVLLEDRSFSTGQLVVAAGPWTGNVLSELGWAANLVPVRGQMALVPRLHDLDALVHLEDSFYVVPRGNYSLVGATSEHGKWSEETTEEGMAELRRRVGTLFPDFDPSRAVERWSGIRPRTRDRVPHLGWLEPGLMVASGHYRSGISMAPLTGVVAAELLTGRTPSHDLSDLDPHRRPAGWRRLP